MEDAILKEDSPLGPYDKRFIPDLQDDKYLFNFDDPLLLKGSKLYKGTKKQFVFKPIDAEMEKVTAEDLERVNRMKSTFMPGKKIAAISGAVGTYFNAAQAQQLKKQK